MEIKTMDCFSKQAQLSWCVCKSELTWDESPWTSVPEVTEDDFAVDFPGASDSFADWLLDAAVSDPCEVFFPRFVPEVVETFQTS